MLLFKIELNLFSQFSEEELTRRLYERVLIQPSFIKLNFGSPFTLQKPFYVNEFINPFVLFRIHSPGRRSIWDGIPRKMIITFSNQDNKTHILVTSGFVTYGFIGKIIFTLGVFILITTFSLVSYSLVKAALYDYHQFYLGIIPFIIPFIFFQDVNKEKDYICSFLKETFGELELGRN